MDCYGGKGCFKAIIKKRLGPILLCALGMIAFIVIFAFVSERKSGSRSQDRYIKKTRILAVNGVEYVTHKGMISNAVLGHMVAGDIGAIIGAMSAE